MAQSVLARLVDPATGTPRSPLFWPTLLLLAAAQFLAFWMVCAQQMRKAEVRRAEMQIQQMALADCLQYIPGATIGSCSGKPPSNAEPGFALAPAQDPSAGVVTVGFYGR